MLLASVIIEPRYRRKVYSSGNCIFLHNWSGHNASTQKKLSFEYFLLKKLIVLEKFEEKRSEDGSYSSLDHKLSIVGLKQRIPKFEVIFRGSHDHRTQSIGLLIVCVVLVVVSGKRIQRTKLVEP